MPYGELEKNLPDFLYSHLPTKVGLDQGSRVTVINGPGSFTNLRIATLALNTFNMLHDFSVDFVSIWKIDWYKNILVTSNQSLVTRYCLMYIGQKKNFWVVDLSGQQSVASSQLMEGVVKLHVDDLKEYVDKLGDDWFVDEMVAEGKEMMDGIFGEGWYKMYIFREEELGDERSMKLLEPNYMIDANID